MRRFVYAFAAGTLALAMAVPVFAQTDANPANGQANQMASVKSGNTIIEGGGAPDADFNVARYKAWDEFRSSHPEVVRDLTHNPRLAGSSSFVNRHPELKQLFESNAGLQQDMLRHPGNYVVPTMAAREWTHHHHHNAKTKATS